MKLIIEVDEKDWESVERRAEMLGENPLEFLRVRLPHELSNGTVDFAD